MDPGLWNPSLRSGPQNPLSPQDPPPPAWWSKKDHHFGGVRCKVVGEWGGSAHQPDPTAQSVAAASPATAIVRGATGHGCARGFGGQAGPFPQPTESPAPSGVVGWQVTDWARVGENSASNAWKVLPPSTQATTAALRFAPGTVGQESTVPANATVDLRNRHHHYRYRSFGGDGQHTLCCQSLR